MPRSREPQMPQRQSARVPLRARNSNSNPDPMHRRPTAERCLKPGDRRGAKCGKPDLNQKKLGSRIADLESQLAQAQDELKVLKKQLISAEASKREVQGGLANKTKKSSMQKTVSNEDKCSPRVNQESDKMDIIRRNEAVDDNQQETDVFEVPAEKVTVENDVDLNQPVDQEERKSKQIDISAEPPADSEPQKVFLDDLSMKNDEIKMLKAELEKKERELEKSFQENASLQKLLNDATLAISSAQTREEEMTLRLSQLGEELKLSKEGSSSLKGKLNGAEAAKEAMEAEMKMLRVQTDQWRKAADAAAAVLAGGVETDRKCSSMDKHFGSVFDTPASGYTGTVTSPGMVDDSGNNGIGSVKKKGSAIKVFGDLWRKKV